MLVDPAADPPTAVEPPSPTVVYPGTATGVPVVSTGTTVRGTVLVRVSPTEHPCPGAEQVHVLVMAYVPLV
jgi:hypothetical protein